MYVSDFKVHWLFEEIVVFDKKFKDFCPWGFDDFDSLLSRVLLRIECCRFDLIWPRGKSQWVEFSLIVIGCIVKKIFPLGIF